MSVQESSQLWLQYIARTELVSRKLTLTVVTEGHLRLAKANRVLSLRDAIELLELGLVNALRLTLESSFIARRSGPGEACCVCLGLTTYLTGKVDLNGFDTDVGRAGGHGCGGMSSGDWKTWW